MKRAGRRLGNTRRPTLQGRSAVDRRWIDGGSGADRGRIEARPRPWVTSLSLLPPAENAGFIRSMATGSKRQGERPSAVALGPTPDTYSVHDQVLTKRMTAADLARVRAEILGEEPPPAPEDEVEIEIEIEPDPEPDPLDLPPDRLAAVRRRIAVHDYSGALLLAEALVADEPDNAVAQRAVATCRTTLENVYLTQLGSRAEVPRIILSPEQLRTHNPDRWAAFIISRVDGMSTIDDIIDVAGMPALDALRILYELLQQGIVGRSGMGR